jgi:hypothetical protein
VRIEASARIRQGEMVLGLKKGELESDKNLTRRNLKLV